MVRVYVICEGQTEEQFVKQLLVEPFAYLGIYLFPTLIGKIGHKGGRVQFDRLQADIKRYLSHDQNAFCTTFFDFYGLPSDFPGKAAAEKSASIADKAQLVSTKLTEKLSRNTGNAMMQHFIPYVQMYEFEALLFSDPKGFASGLSQPQYEGALRLIREAFATPEEINDSAMTAPSKRIQGLLGNYQKPTDGINAAKSIGLSTMRKECRLFNAWLKQLEQLTSSESA